MKRLFGFLLALLLVAPLSAETITVDNTSRNYLVYAPENLGPQRPLLISCHGMNQDAAYQRDMLKIESIADTAKFVTVFPNGIDRGWDIGGDRDLKFMEALIDEMVTKYDIDRNRVYISGFSMGGMFTYHAMNRMADKFAAFAPISGYPMGGGTYTSSRPVPIIHTHGTTDDVVNFGGVANILAGWVKRNGCPTTAKVKSPYRANHITRHTWGPGENGVEVVLLELANKGHWISNDVVFTGEEIWNFCKRYSLEIKEPSVKLTSPEDGLTFVAIGGAVDVPPITISATASDPDGKVAKVEFFLNGSLLAEMTEAPYTYVLENLSKGTHYIRAVVTDDEGRTGSFQRSIAVKEVTGTHQMASVFATAGSVPNGWTTYDGNEKRVGYSSGYSSGSRVFQFTGTQKDFEWGLYTRNATGGVKAGYARYAAEETAISLLLHPGNYQFSTRVCNWNIPTFSPVTVAIETLEGKTVYANTFTPTANVGNAATNNFSGTTAKTFSFDIHEKGYYMVTFYTADAPWADLVIGRASLTHKGAVSALSGVSDSDDKVISVEYFDMAGMTREASSPGIYICRETLQDGSCRSNKIVIK